MALFTKEWIQHFASAWNDEPAIFQPLKSVDFTGKIAYGFLDEEFARFALNVVNGRVVAVNSAEAEDLCWDVRAHPEDWQKFANVELSIMDVSMAYTSRKLQFKAGNYASMIRDPMLSKVFLKSFEIMAA